ncbi:hypothetical protein ACQKNC_15960 [Lysinibacillus sp. NPDC094177]|uniref:hypothetical protein n=1 Tax=Lysinibacillus sp. NPDC094177 TaxID=3390580 RepID=UPI003CFD974D
MQDKLKYLEKIREDVGEAAYRINAATIITKDYINLLRSRGIKKDRITILNQVNSRLNSIGVEKVSYGFIRKFY